MTPVLLVFTFLLGSGAAFIAPAWQAIVSKLVPRGDLTAAVTRNSMGNNIGRAIGPAVAGLLVAGCGLVWPFALNAVSTLVVIAALCWWTPAKAPATPPSGSACFRRDGGGAAICVAYAGAAAGAGDIGRVGFPRYRPDGWQARHGSPCCPA